MLEGLGGQPVLLINGNTYTGPPETKRILASAQSFLLGRLFEGPAVEFTGAAEIRHDQESCRSTSSSSLI